MKRVTKHAAVGTLAIWAYQNKIAIQSAIDGGKTVSEFAQEKNIPILAMRTIFTSAGISHGYKKNPIKIAAAKDAAIVTVLLRLAKGLGVDHSELLPFVE